MRPPAGCPSAGRGRAAAHPSAAGSGPAPACPGPATAGPAGPPGARRPRRGRRRGSRPSPPRLASVAADAGPRRDVPPRRRPERPQVRPNEVGQALVLGGVRRPDPVLREGEPVRAAALPRPGRRHPDEVHPQPEIADEAGAERAELLHRPRTVGQRRPHRLGLGDQLGLGRRVPGCAVPRRDAARGRPSHTARTRRARPCGSSSAGAWPG